MKIWNVISIGDGEAYSAWLTEGLARENAEALANRIMPRCSNKAIYYDVRVLPWEHENLEIEVALNLDLHGDPMWSHHGTIRVSAVEVQGDAISRLAAVST